MAARNKSTVSRLLRRLRDVIRRVSPLWRGRELRKAQRDLLALRRALAGEYVDRRALDEMLDAYRVNDERLRRYISATLLRAMRSGEIDADTLAELEARIPDAVHENYIREGVWAMADGWESDAGELP